MTMPMPRAPKPWVPRTIQAPVFGRAPAALQTVFFGRWGTILFDQDGRPLATPALRRKPGVVAPDAVNTTFFFADREDDEDRFPNFFGTSAAAPHAAAVAALVLQANRTLFPPAVYERLRTTATDMPSRSIR